MRREKKQKGRVDNDKSREKERKGKYRKSI